MCSRTSRTPAGPSRRQTSPRSNSEAIPSTRVQRCPRVDADGNEIGGLRLPDLTVPLATYTGWAFRSERVGAPSEILPMAGSYAPFARTRVEREERGDPRLSIGERYASRADYLRRVHEAAERLVDERYLLREDVKRIVDRAGEHWDWLMRTVKSSGS